MPSFLYEWCFSTGIRFPEQGHCLTFIFPVIGKVQTGMGIFTGEPYLYFSSFTVKTYDHERAISRDPRPAKTGLE